LRGGWRQAAAAALAGPLGLAFGVSVAGGTGWLADLLPPSSADVAPRVVSVSISAGGVVSVRFSEPVRARVRSFGLACPPRISRGLELSRSPASRYRLTPRQIVAAGTPCRIVVRAKRIHDLDRRRPETMKKNFTVTLPVPRLTPPAPPKTTSSTTTTGTSSTTGTSTTETTTTGTTSTTTTTSGTPVSHTGAAKILGTPRDGQTLTESDPTFSGTAPITISSQWERCDSAGAACADVVGAAGTTYALNSSDVGHTIRVVVTGSNGDSVDAATSGPTGVVQALGVSHAGTATILGTAMDGQTLTASDPSFSGSTPITVSRQWQQCDSTGGACSDIGGETGTTYVLVTADVGHTIRVAVSASNASLPGGSTDAVTSLATGVVQAIPVTHAGDATILGSAADGQTLTAGDPTFSGSPPISVTHQWQRCDAGGASCGDIAGARGASYVLTPSDVGHTIRFVVSGDNTALVGGTKDVVISAATAVVDEPPDVCPPTISEYGSFWGGSTPGGIQVTGAAIWSTLSSRLLYCLPAGGRNGRGATARVVTYLSPDGNRNNYFEAGFAEYLSSDGHSTAVRAFTEVGTNGAGASVPTAFPCNVVWGASYQARVQNIGGNTWAGYINCGDGVEHFIGQGTVSSPGGATGVPDSEVFRTTANDDVETLTDFRYRAADGSWPSVTGIFCRRDTDPIYSGQPLSATSWHVVNDDRLGC
jgi:hypothetical protein